MAPRLPKGTSPTSTCSPPAWGLSVSAKHERKTGLGVTTPPWVPQNHRSPLLHPQLRHRVSEAQCDPAQGGVWCPQCSPCCCQQALCAVGGKLGSHHCPCPLCCRDYARCDPESEEEGRMEGEHQSQGGARRGGSREGGRGGKVLLYPKLTGCSWGAHLSPGAGGGPAEHAHALVLLQDDRHHDRGHH